MFKNLEVIEGQNIEVRPSQGILQGRVLPVSSGVVIGFARVKLLLKYDTVPREYVVSVAGVPPASWIDVAVAIPRIPYRRAKWLNKMLKDNAVWVSIALWATNMALRFTKILSSKIPSDLPTTQV